MSKTTRIGSAVMAVILLLSTLLPLTVSAADVTMDLSNCEVSWDYTLTDEEGNTFSAAYGIRDEDNPFGGAVAPLLRRMHDYTAKRKGLTGNNSTWTYGEDYVYCYCVEHGVPLPDSGSYAGSSDPAHGNKYEMLSDEQKDLLSLALAYGYPNRTDLETSKDANACYSASQLIIWQITLGFRTSPTELNDKSYPMSGYSGTMTEQYCANKYLKAYYDKILADMASHYTRPDFTSDKPGTAKTYELSYSGDKYTLTLTDKNNVLSKYYVSSSGGVSVKISGNTLTVSSDQPITDSTTIKLNRRMPSTNHTTGFLIWSVPGREEANQDMVSGVPADNDPVPSYFKVKAPAREPENRQAQRGRQDRGRSLSNFRERYQQNGADAGGRDVSLWKTSFRAFTRSRSWRKTNTSRRPPSASRWYPARRLLSPLTTSSNEGI